MTARVKPIAAALANAYDFSSVDLIVDIGGGHGELLVSLLLKYPALKGSAAVTSQSYATCAPGRNWKSRT